MVQPSPSRQIILAAAGGAAGFVTLWLLISLQSVGSLDSAFLEWVRHYRTDHWTRVAVWITNAGSINVLVPCAVLVAGALLLFGRRRLGLLFLSTLLWYPFLLPFRLVVDRPAPPAEVRSATEGVIYLAEAPIERAGRSPTLPPVRREPVESGTSPEPATPWYAPLTDMLYHSLTRSFPSNHAATSAYFYGLCLLLAWNRGWRAAAAGIVVLIGLIGGTRVYMGVHYPTDVLASWSLAAAALAGARLALPRKVSCLASRTN